MKRQWNMDEVSDGKRYQKGDLVAAGCDDCSGCHSCCEGVEDTIILDPYDIYRLSKHLDMTMEQMLQGQIELSLSDGLILPHLAMTKENHCSFLNAEGRCSIHAARPGICRLFPLGRIYERDGFSYFLQVHECTKSEHTMVRISDWMDTPAMSKYEKYITKWHDFLLEWQKVAADSKEQKQTLMYLLMLFYHKPYDTKADFYPQFYQRLEEALKLAR